MQAGIVTTADRHAELLASANAVVDAKPIAPDALSRASVDLLVAPSVAELRAVVAAGVHTPIVLVDGPDALDPVGPDGVERILPAVDRGDGTTEHTHRTVGVRANDTETFAIAEAVAMTDEPATISEYAIHQDDRTVGRYRADGVVIGSAVGSHGYTRSAGGPILEPTLPAMAVVPIAPYRTDPDHWVVDGRVTVEVLRDVGDVGLYVDGERRCDLGKDEQLTCTLGPTYRTLSI